MTATDTRPEWNSHSTRLNHEEVSQKLENAKNLYLEGIAQGRVREAIEKYTGTCYTQHSTGVRDGVAGFVEFFEPFLVRYPHRDIRILRSVEEGPCVFLHVYQNLNHGGAEWITMDLFDTDSIDKIVEHWDVIAPAAKQTVSGLPAIHRSTARA